jgi:hypothetical protein
MISDTYTFEDDIHRSLLLLAQDSDKAAQRLASVALRSEATSTVCRCWATFHQPARDYCTERGV